MHQNLDVILWQFNYTKNSFIVLIPERPNRISGVIKFFVEREIRRFVKLDRRGDVVVALVVVFINFRFVISGIFNPDLKSSVVRSDVRFVPRGQLDEVG